MSRIQLALNVSDLESAIRFYTQLLGVEPRKVRPGYANFAVDDPALKLVLIAGDGAPGTLNHLGVEVGSTEDVRTAIGELQAAGIATDVRDSELCCHAVQDKVWVRDPDGARWEVYTVLDDAPVEPGGRVDLPVTASCC